MAFMDHVLLLGVTALLVLINAFFVASEFAIVKIRPTRLEELVRQGNGRAKLALRLVRRLDSYLSANQLGITLASIGLGWIGEPAIADLIAPGLASLGSLAAPTAHTASLTISFVVISSLHTIIGELAPKSLAIQRTERVALWTALPLHGFFLLMWPFIWFLNGAANGFIRLFGLHPARDEELRHTSEELRMLLTTPVSGLDAELRRMLVRIFDFRRRTARHVMSLRTDAATLRANMTIDEAVKVAGDAGYTRYPVLDEAGQTAVGYVHVRDLFDVLRGARRARVLGELLRKPLVARESTSVEGLRKQMQSTLVPLAVIVSDANDFIGIVTIEDLLEEIVGEIRDELDVEVPPIHQRGVGLLEVDGRILLEDLERETGIVLSPPVERAETVAGYVIGRLGRPAAQNEAIECDGYTLIPVDVAGRRIRRVRIVARPPTLPPDAAEGT
jgi:CBS domain containing-hemolysin-like protein